MPLLGFLFWPWIPTQRDSIGGGGEGRVLRYLGDGVAGDGRRFAVCVKGRGCALWKRTGGRWRGHASAAWRGAARMLEQAKIPRRYEKCTLKDFNTNYEGADRSLQSALAQARGFVKGYPVETNGKGLLLVGPVGVGKTHIAVGILKELVQERGAHGLFDDYRSC